MKTQLLLLLALGTLSLPAPALDAWALGPFLKRPEPFLWPELDWEKRGLTGDTTVANTLVPFRSRWMLYYGGADTVIGLAVGPAAN